MSKMIEKINNLSLPAVLLIVSLILGSFYLASQVIKQKSIEKQQQIELSQKREEQLLNEIKEQGAREKEEQAKEDAKQALDTCLADAESNYSDQWFEECKALGKLTTRCISLQDMSFDDYLQQGNTLFDVQGDRVQALLNFYDEKEECSCRLPMTSAENVEGYRDKSKDECFKKYPQK